jgi:nicotinamide mononucleotide transporter
MNALWQQFLYDLSHTSWMEYVAVVAGIASVWYSKKENILVYPVGLVNTIIYIFISLKGHLYGEASVNFYYTVVSLYGWFIWARRDHVSHEHLLQISFSNRREWTFQLLFFSGFYIVLFVGLSYLKKSFSPGAIPWADAFASATAYTGMWLMARKKVESWWWWILTNMASVPLYFVKHYVLTSLYYLILLGIAFAGLAEWRRRAVARDAKINLS